MMGLELVTELRDGNPVKDEYAHQVFTEFTDPVTCKLVKVVNEGDYVALIYHGSSWDITWRLDKVTGWLAMTTTVQIRTRNGYGPSIHQNRFRRYLYLRLMNEGALLDRNAVSADEKAITGWNHLVEIVNESLHLSSFVKGSW